MRALAEEKYLTPTPIQSQTIPSVMSGRDVIGIAQTGTGKTAAFALPILHRLAASPRPPVRKSCRVLVLSPTRELSSQILDSFRAYGRHLRIRAALAIGGVSMGGQVRTLLNGVDVLVATPGKHSHDSRPNERTRRGKVPRSYPDPIADNSERHVGPRRHWNCPNWDRQNCRLRTSDPAPSRREPTTAGAQELPGAGAQPDARVVRPNPRQLPHLRPPHARQSRASSAMARGMVAENISVCRWAGSLATI